MWRRRIRPGVLAAAGGAATYEQELLAVVLAAAGGGPAVVSHVQRRGTCGDCHSPHGIGLLSK